MIARTRVLESNAETPSVHAVRIAKPPGFDFRPVQFVGLEIPTENGPEEYSMSLACSPTRPYLEFGARISASPWKQAFRSLRQGDEVEIDGPYGHFILDEERPAVLIAGGIGITPLKGMMEYATDKKLPIPMTLLYSNRTEAEIAYRSELESLARANPRVRIRYTLTRLDPASSWKGPTGRIGPTQLEESVREHPEAAFYICGLPAMVEDVVLGLRDLGLTRERVHYEQFWGYDG